MGVVDELRAKEGEVVPVGDVLITVQVGEDDLEDDDTGSADPAHDREQSSKTTVDTADTDVSDRAGSTGEVCGDRGRPIAPPSVRRFTREHDVDLAALVSGRSATRLTKSDVRAAIDSSPERTEAESTEPVADRSEQPTDGVSDPVSLPPSDVSVTESSPVAGRSLTLARPNTRRIARENEVGYRQRADRRTPGW